MAAIRLLQITSEEFNTNKYINLMSICELDNNLTSLEIFANYQNS